MGYFPASNSKGMGTIITKTVSTGVTIPAGTNTNYIDVTDSSLGGKIFEGYQVNGVLKSVFPIMAYISESEFNIRLVNTSGSSVTTGSIKVFYREP